MSSNYFELFGLPVQFNIDKNSLKTKFFILSREFHPDHFTNNNQNDQDIALERSAELNKAYKILSNKDATIKYVLTIKGLLQEEEKYNLHPEFLMQMMEINEQLAEVLMDEDPQALNELQRKMNEIKNEIYEPVREIIENYKEGNTTTKELLQVKDYYFKKKYLHRLQQQLSEKL